MVKDARTHGNAIIGAEIGYRQLRSMASNGTSWRTVEPP
jgi:hypothetical protein